MLTLLVLTMSACSTLTQPAPTVVIVEPTSQPVSTLTLTEADVPRVTPEKALIAFNSGEAIIVDVRSIEAFAAQHIKGALSMPLTGIETDPGNVALDKNQWIITYCT